MSEEQKESSVLFSLQELFSLEQDRIKQEEDDSARKAEDARAAEEEARRRAIEEEQARLQAEEDQRRNEDQRQREESARLEALRQGEIERARVGAEEQARLEALRQQQTHAMDLARLKQDKHKKKLTIGIGVAVAVLVIGGATGGSLWYRSAQEAEAERARIAAINAAKEKELEQLKAQLLEQDQKVNGLVASLSSAQDEATKAKLKAELDAAQKARAATAGAIRGGGGGKKDPGTPKPACTCTPGDPLCGCL